METTCQICGRSIKAKHGLIAHHGYKRPQWGFQTDSCLGARYAPYEESRERLVEVMELFEAHIKEEEVAFKTFQENPPETITVRVRKSSWDKEGTEVVYTRPENFTPNGYSGSIPRTYANAYDLKRRQWETSIKAAKKEYEFLDQRFARWGDQPQIQEAFDL